MFPILEPEILLMNLPPPKWFVGVGFEWAGDFSSCTLWTFFIFPISEFLIEFLHSEMPWGTASGDRGMLRQLRPIELFSTLYLFSISESSMIFSRTRVPGLVSVVDLAAWVANGSTGLYGGAFVDIPSFGDSAMLLWRATWEESFLAANWAMTTVSVSCVGSWPSAAIIASMNWSVDPGSTALKVGAAWMSGRKLVDDHSPKSVLRWRVLSFPRLAF